MNMNKLKVKMNKFKILGVALSSVAFSYAQDIDQAKKRSTPKSTKRKITLKSIIKSDPDEVLPLHFRECLPYSKGCRFCKN
jgi:hypothetical protein